jgi:hypothetical protein
VSVEGDARSARQSSSPSETRAGLRKAADRFARLAFAAFVLVHLAWQAVRAHGDGARPDPGIELAPWFVTTLLLVVWAPFALFAARELRRIVSDARVPERGETARALAVVERLSLLGVVLFAAVHGAQTAWPLITGSSAAGDLRPQLIADLSGTNHGLPVQGIVYLCAVGAAAFYATRQILALLGGAPRSAVRGVVTLGVLAYVLGSYAVIRCAGGSIFP